MVSRRGWRILNIFIVTLINSESNGLSKLKWHAHWTRLKFIRAIWNMYLITSSMLYLSSILHISCKEKSSFALIVPDCVVEQRIRKRLLIKSQLKFIPCILYFKSLTFYKSIIKVAVKRSDHFFYFRLCFYCSVSSLLSELTKHPCAWLCSIQKPPVSVIQLPPPQHGSFVLSSSLKFWYFQLSTFLSSLCAIFLPPLALRLVISVSNYWAELIENYSWLNDR